MAMRKKGQQAKVNTNGNGSHGATSPWTDTFSRQGKRNGHGANGHNTGKPAYPQDEAEVASRDALMQCYNG